MSVAILTGGTGFLGSHLLSRLVENEWDVIALKRAQSKVPECFASTNRIRWLDSDDWTQIDAALASTPVIDAVFHLATAYGRADEATSDTVSTNVIFPLRLLELSLRQKVGLFMNTDTCFTVDYPYLQSYTLSKKQFAAWGKMLASQGSMRFVTLELQHPFGPGDRLGKFVPWIIEQCCQDRVTIPLTTGEQQKDFIFVDDVINAYLTIVQKISQLAAGYHHFECGRGEAIPLRRFVETVHLACRSNCELAFGAMAYRDREIMHSAADISKLTSMGWTPHWSVEEGIANCVAAYRASNAVCKK